jgi:hypothetical protein
MTNRKTTKSTKTTTAGSTPVDKTKEAVAMSPNLRNSFLASRYSNEVSGIPLDALGCYMALSDQIRPVQAGNLAGVEAMLMGQANALEAMFTHLAGRAFGRDHLPTIQTFTTLALKAQAQCRATLETLAEIKNPRPVAFVKQANIANGPQQVNNGTPMQADGTPARAGKTETEPNKLLEADHDARMDTRAPGAAIGSDTEMAAVGSIQRPDKRRRQG